MGILIGLLSSVLLAPVTASALRVGNQLVQEGDSRMEVLHIRGGEVVEIEENLKR